MKILQRQKGFTLLELLVVVAIIAILAAAIIINLNRARAEANDARIQSDLRSISDAIQVYQNSGGDPDDLVSSFTTFSTDQPGDLAVLIQENLLEIVPTHPASNKNFQYVAGIDNNTGLLNYVLQGDLGAGADAGDCFQVKNGSPTTIEGACPANPSLN